MVTWGTCGYYYGIIISYSYNNIVTFSDRQYYFPIRILKNALWIILTIKKTIAQIHITTHPYPNARCH